MKGRGFKKRPPTTIVADGWTHKLMGVATRIRGKRGEVHVARPHRWGFPKRGRGDSAEAACNLCLRFFDPGTTPTWKRYRRAYAKRD